MKLVSFIISIMLSVTCSAQQKHLTFMGLPIDGNIDRFTEKMIKKGMRLDTEYNKTSPYGERRFRGLFMGRAVAPIVRYTSKTKTVFCIEFGFANESVQVVNDFDSDFVTSIKTKYEDFYYIKDEKSADKTIYIYKSINPEESEWTDIVGILQTRRMTIEVTPKAGYTENKEKFIYTIKISYIDRANLDLRNKEVTDDV